MCKNSIAVKCDWSTLESSSLVSALKGTVGVRSSCFNLRLFEKLRLIHICFNDSQTTWDQRCCKSSLPHFRCVSNRMCVKSQQSSELPSEPSLAPCWCFLPSEKLSEHDEVPSVWHLLQWKREKLVMIILSWLLQINKAWMLFANNFLRIKTRNREMINTLLKYIFAEFMEQWHMVVIVAGCSLFVTSQYYAIFTFVNHRFG